MKDNDQIRFTLVTGASSGIGHALALELAKRGRDLVLVALPEEGLQAFSEKLAHEFKIQCEFFEIDLTEEKAAQKVYDWCIHKEFRINCLINNAGVGMGDHFDRFDTLFYEKMMILNMSSLVGLTRLFLPELQRHDRAFILNMGSLAGFYPSPYKAVYAATKSFVNMFSLALGEEDCCSRISVSVLCPGSVPTNDDVKKRIPKRAYLARAALLSSERVARIALNKMDKGKNIIIPGFINQLYFFLGSLLPIKARTRFLARLFKKYYIPEKSD